MFSFATKHRYFSVCDNFAFVICSIYTFFPSNISLFLASMLSLLQNKSVLPVFFPTWLWYNAGTIRPAAD